MILVQVYDGGKAVNMISNAADSATGHELEVKLDADRLDAGLMQQMLTAAGVDSAGTARILAIFGKSTE